ncbi:uncharacterized protein LOC144120263 [Amblyomma americanum]
MFILAFVGGNLALVGMLLVTMILYVCGLLITAWGGEEGFCSFRSGRWCFSLGACVFVLLFGVVAVATTAGLTAAFLATRCACGLANDLGSQGLADPIRFGLSVVREHANQQRVRDLASAVTVDNLRQALTRFSACGAEPTSAYHLAGEALLRNASKAVGLEKEVAFIWEGFNQTAIDAQLENITGPMNVTVDLNKTTELAQKMRSLLNISLAIPTSPSEPDLKSQVSTINTNTDSAEALKKALGELKPLAAGAGIATEVDEAEKEVDDLVLKFHNCTRAKVTSPIQSNEFSQDS